MDSVQSVLGLPTIGISMYSERFSPILKPYLEGRSSIIDESRAIKSWTIGISIQKEWFSTIPNSQLEGHSSVIYDSRAI